MGINFTPDQQKVIELHNRNILVSAAAGSGKTAVLVERIVQMVSDEKHPVDIDRLLIVTFTNAAAGEMRERISKALSKRLEENPQSIHLQKQVALIHNAQITTIDSFCLFIIRNNFHDIGLDPTFRVADEGELKLLKQDVMAELMEEKFVEADTDFLHCVECYAANGRETVLENHILSLYNFAMSHPWPRQWLAQRKKDYHISTIEELEQTDWISYALMHIRESIQDINSKYTECLRICEMPDGPYMYGELLEKEQAQIQKLLDIDTFSEMAEKISTIQFDRLLSKKDDSVNPLKRELAKQLRGEVKELIGSLKERYFATSLELMLEQGLYSERAVNVLLDLTLLFEEKLSQKKREKNILDFSDMEHFALNILLKKTEDGYETTETAKDYQKFYKEVLIDEYQDSNLVQEYLLKAVSGEETGNYNRFMVGDVKQSIYKFRLARPELFMEKYQNYSTQDSLCQRIDLYKNFRSRQEVIGSVNYIFSQIMGEKLGSICYDESQALNLGATYPENSDCETELLLMEKPAKEEKLDTKEAEAYLIASKIRELVGKFQVTDGKMGTLRPAKYGDIVILLRSNSGWDEVFKRALAEKGIPTHTASKTGYFSTTEISQMMQFLRVLDNPLQDIPLFGVLKSIFGELDEEEIVKIRKYSEEDSLYRSLCAYAQKGEAGKTKEKANLFLQRLRHYRETMVYLPIQKLLQQVMADFDYLYYVTAMPAGEQRKANVEMLLEKAGDFEKTSYHGLFHFIRYMEQLEKYDVDYGEANTLDEKADVVRIMSIHKSKGLEFPITFVAGLSKRFNMQDANQALIVDLDMGIGTDYVDPVQRISNKTLRKNVIARKMQLDNLGEELRILYVALTRAKEKLIMTGVIDKPLEKIAAWSAQCYREETLLPFSDLANAGSYLDYILPALIRHRAFVPLLKQAKIELHSNNPLFQLGPDIKIQLWNMDNITGKEVQELTRTALQKERLNELETVDEEVFSQMEERFSYQYPHQNLEKLYTKTTVSELKMAAMQEENEIAHTLFKEETITPYLPKFKRGEKNISGSTRGSAFHRVLELLDFEQVLTEEAKMTDEELKERLYQCICLMKEKGRLSEEYYQAISAGSIEKLVHFFRSKLAQRMRDAQIRGELFREQPFVYGIAANRLSKDFPKEEKVLIQGIVDVFFIEEGKLVLADYKTDAVKTEEELKSRYHTQLEYYEEALSRMMGMKMKEKILYSFGLGKEVWLNE